MSSPLQAITGGEILTRHRGRCAIQFQAGDHAVQSCSPGADGRESQVHTIIELPIANAPKPEPAPPRATNSGINVVLFIAVVAVQALHFGLHLSLANPVFGSDLLQAVAAALSAIVCLFKGHRGSRHWNLWVGLSVAFSIWAIAQLYYAFGMLRPGARDVPLSELLWLIYAFPMLLVISYTPQASSRDPAGWLDAAQAGIFFSILIALFYPSPGIITQGISDDVQGVALLLALVIRYCTAEPGSDRLFFRNLTAYMTVYVFFCVLYYLLTTHGFAVGSIAEVCWSIPFTVFSIMALCTDPLKKAEESHWHRMSEVVPASYVQGASALGLAIMSLTASAVLAYHRPMQGAILLAVAFLLFAARTSTREWQLQSIHSKLNYSVLHDPLTSVANRTLLDAEITRRLVSSSGSADRSISVLFVGLDRFKTLNDCLGHAFGDLLLQNVATVLSSSIRKQDLIARYGGDEFVVLLDSVNAKEARSFAERTLDLLKNPMFLGGRVLNVTASIGYTVGAAEATAAGMLQQAHFAMHHAKKAGKDRAQIFEMEMVRVPQYKLALETDLRKTLADDAITVFYQPIFAVESGEIVGFEALARWLHPERGSVSPADFIPVAEDTGLILELGQQILRKACKQCREWNRTFGTAYTMNVNVSAHQFANPHVLTQIVSTLYETGLEPRFLKLEITESVLISGYTCVEEVLRKVQKLGVQICLDDFGTGYSSLSYLLNYPFDVVKIDQSFVRNLDQDPRRADVVRTLVDLAGSLKKHLVAEGVERPEEMACLKNLRCELAQGYLLSKPLSAEMATRLLEAHENISSAGLLHNRIESGSGAFLVGTGISKPAA